MRSKRRFEGNRALVKAFFTRVLSSLRPKVKQAWRSEDVIRAYDAGEYELPYEVTCHIMAKKGWWSEEGDVYLAWADLERRVTHDGQRALELLDKARELGCSEDAYYVTKRGEVLWEMGDEQQAVECFERSVAISPDLLNRMQFAWALSSFGLEAGRRLPASPLNARSKTSQTTIT